MGRSCVIKTRRWKSRVARLRFRKRGLLDATAATLETLPPSRHVLGAFYDAPGFIAPPGEVN